jgi:hypothetical protein
VLGHSISDTANRPEQCFGSSRAVFVKFTPFCATLQSFLLLRRVLARMAAPLFAPGKTDIDGALQQILVDAPLTMRRTVTTP